MKRSITNKGGLYEYLKPFLETGDEQVIAQAKNEYRRRYQAQWRKSKRKTQKTFEISFAPDEWKTIRGAKLKHTRSYTTFIKYAALAYCEKKYLAPDQLAHNNVCQTLYMAYNKVKDIEESGKLSIQQGEELLRLFSSIEHTIERQLKNPQTLEETIIEIIQAQPFFKSKLVHLLQNI